MSYMYVNQTSEKDTLYYSEEASFLCIKPFMMSSLNELKFIYGTSAEYIFKKLSTAEPKKVAYSKMKRFLEYLHLSIDDRSSDPFESMAGLEKILEEIR